MRRHPAHATAREPRGDGDMSVQRTEYPVARPGMTGEARVRRPGRSCPTAPVRTRPRSSSRASVERSAPAGTTRLGGQLVERRRRAAISSSTRPSRAFEGRRRAAAGTVPRAHAVEQVEHVLGPADQGGAVPEQPVRARGDRRRDPARHRGDLAADVRRAVGRDQRARPLRGLDHDRQPAERGHDPVARREQPPVGARARRHLGDDRAAPAESGRRARGSCAGRRRRRRSRARRPSDRRRRGSPGGRPRRCRARAR